MFLAFVDIDTMSNLMKFGFSTSKPIKEEKRKGLEKVSKSMRKTKENRVFIQSGKTISPGLSILLYGHL